MGIIVVRVFAAYDSEKFANMKSATTGSEIFVDAIAYLILSGTEGGGLLSRLILSTYPPGGVILLGASGAYRFFSCKDSGEVILRGPGECLPLLL